MATRRKFLKGLGAVLAGFSILPAASTYDRVWKKSVLWVPNPAWVSAPYECVTLSFNPDGKYVVHKWNGPPSYVAAADHLQSLDGDDFARFQVDVTHQHIAPV